MFKIKIFGAGSIGNHLANASYIKGWDVTLCDIDKEALNRTKYQIYPSRYGSFPAEIKLFHNDDAPKNEFDLIFVGTPPDTHISVALKALKEKPKAILVEKPFCTPDLKGAQELFDKAKQENVRIFVGYDHVVAPSTKKFLDLAKSLKNIQTFEVFFREHWEGIFKAHPWLDGPKDTYLGYLKKGGGALGEHSHALNLWQHIAHSAGFGRVIKVNATLDYVNDGVIYYDKLAMIHLTTERGLVGSVVQDVITKPSLKYMKIQGETKSIDWECRSNPYSDIVSEINDIKSENVFNKNRPDDFISELDHIENVIINNKTSPIDIEFGLNTMLVIAAAHKSSINEKVVTIHYNKGYNLNAID